MVEIVETELHDEFTHVIIPHPLVETTLCGVYYGIQSYDLNIRNLKSIREISCPICKYIIKTIRS